MKLSKKTLTYMEPFIEHMDTFVQLPRTRRTKQRIDHLLKKMFYSWKHSNLQYNKLIESNDLYYHLYPVTQKRDLLEHSLLRSSYVPRAIQIHILENTNYILQYKCSVHKKPIEILIGIENTNNISQYDNYVKQMLKVLYFFNEMNTFECKYPLQILLFPTSYTKHIPVHNMEVINSSHVNSAVTTNCSPRGNSILIYRKEEWLKVFCHELMHSLNLDYSYIDVYDFHRSLQTLFRINQTIKSYEAYTEFWATIIHTSFVASQMVDLDSSASNDIELQQFILQYELYMHFEKMFSVFQMVKLLHFMYLTYNDVLQHPKSEILFKQQTNAFSYYILKTIYLVHSDEFLLWCYHQNVDSLIKFVPTRENLRSLFGFIKRYYKSDNLSKYVEVFQDKYNAMIQREKTHSKPSILNTMRMTLIGL